MARSTTTQSSGATRVRQRAVLNDDFETLLRNDTRLLVCAFNGASILLCRQRRGRRARHPRDPVLYAECTCEGNTPHKRCSRSKRCTPIAAA
eukprot:4022411-Pyramimonas_sp.AAC.2